jgi:hypothetical protein
MCAWQVRLVYPVYIIQLIFKEDTLYIMAGLGLLDMLGEDSYKANAVTQHLVEYPTKIQGILHL